MPKWSGRSPPRKCLPVDDHTDPESVGRDEFEGEDLEQALSHASASLGIPPDNLDYEVLQEGRRGFLGVGTRGVRIRVASQKPGNVAERDESGGESAENAAQTDLVRINRFLERFVQASPFELGFQVTESPDKIGIELQGKDCELFLARRGEGLNALQVLLGRIASHVGSTRAVFLDCGDFRKGREEELSEIALLTAEKVKRLGEPQTLSPMNPYDRRLIHLALKDDPALETRSEGEGFLKTITIFPRSR
jgi:spoIIIJ-associated protein